MKSFECFLLLLNFLFVIFNFVFGFLQLFEVLYLIKQIILVGENYYNSKYQCCADLFVVKFR